MARKSNQTRVTEILGRLSTTALGSLADFFEQAAIIQSAENISDLEDATVSASKRKTRTTRRAKDEDEKPTRGRRTKRVSKDEDDEKPARTRRTRKVADEDEDDEDEKPARARKVRATPFDEAPTMDDIYDFLENFEGEPVEGGIRELKPQVVAIGGDADALTEGAETRAEKAEELGMFLAAHNAVKAKLMKHDADDLDELLEELGLEAERSKAATIAAILLAIHSGDESEGDDADEDEDEDEDEKPARRTRKTTAKAPAKTSRRSKVEDDEDEDEDEDEDADEDELDDEEDDEEDEKPARRSSKKAKPTAKKRRTSKDEDDELDDLDDID